MMMLLQCCIRQQIWKTQQWSQDGKMSAIPIPKKGNAEECSNYCTIVLISHASKIMPQILQARFQQYVNGELPDAQVGFRKSRGTRNQIANMHWIIEKESSRKITTSASCSLPHPLSGYRRVQCPR